MRKVLVVVGFGLLMLTGCGAAAGDDLAIEVSLDSQPLSESSRSNPIMLERGDTADLQLALTNNGEETVTVEHILLEGEVVDMAFLSYDTAVQESIDPGTSRELAVPVDFFDLGGQANGLLAGQVNVFDAERNSLGAQEAIFDVRGGVWSTLTSFNLLLAFGFVASLLWNLRTMSRRNLPRNRFARGLRFSYTGLAGGLAISVAFSLLRLWPLGTATWLTVTIIGGLVGFGAGYLAPGPVDEDPDDVLDLIDIESTEKSGVTATS